MHVVLAVGDAEQAEEPGEQLGHGVGVEVGQLALHALGLAGGARRVVHGRAGGAVVGERVGLLGQRRLDVAEAGHGAVGEAGLGGHAGLVGRRRDHLGEALVGHDRLRAESWMM